MRGFRPSLLVVALCVAGSAHAQQAAAAPAQRSPSGEQPAQRGFFAPTPGDDPSLSRTLPPEAYVPPSATQQPQANAQPAAATPPIVVVVPDPNLENREQLERAQIEAQQAAARMRQAPAPINGAFTGATDEADRR